MSEFVGNVYIIEHMVTFLILFNNMVPISLYVSMELVKVVQNYRLEHDKSMEDEVNAPALAHLRVARLHAPCHAWRTCESRR
jgi:magnesium-transporting ATPase (P-type)